MNTLLAAVLLLATVCPDTVSGVRIELTGSSCNPPPRPYIQWWTGGTGIKNWRGDVNASPGEVHDSLMGRAFTPSTRWATADGASDCVQGQLIQRPNGCHALFDLTCARRYYRLRVREPGVTIKVQYSVPAVKIHVQGSVMRRTPAGRCDIEPNERNARERYSNGDWVIASLFMGDVALCQRTIELDKVPADGLVDVCDVRKHQWIGGEKQLSRPRARNAERPEKLLSTVTLEVIPER